MIEVQNLSRRFRNVEALSQVNFTVEPGQILGLIGPNGSGKSTTIRCLTGILRPDTGTIRINGHDLVQDPIPAKQALAYLPDNPAFFESLVAWEHVALAAKIYRVKNFEARANELFEQFELTDRKEALGSELSRGMRQRLSLICALIHDPKVIVMDEPMLGLDPKGIHLINEVLKQRAGAGCAILLSSHFLALLEEVATKVLVLAGGKQRLYGSVSEVKKQISKESERLSLEELFFYATEK